LKTSESVAAQGFTGIFTAAWFSEMTILLGFRGLKFSRNEIIFFRKTVPCSPENGLGA